MNTQPEVEIVEAVTEDIDYDSDEGDPLGWVLFYISERFYVKPMPQAVYDEKLLEANKLPPLEANGLLDLLESMNQKRKLIISTRTAANKLASYLLFCNKVENMILMKNWKLIVDNFDYSQLGNDCESCVCGPCIWDTFSVCVIELIRDFYDDTPVFQMTDMDKRNCRTLISFLMKRIQKGFPTYLFMNEVPRCVVEGTIQCFPIEARNEIPIPNFNFN